MQSLDYTLTPQDYIAFNLYVMTRLPFGRRQRRSYRWALSLLTLFVGTGVIWLLSRDLSEALTVGVVSSVAIWLLAPWLWRLQLRRNFKRLSKDSGLGAEGAHRIGLDDSGLHESSPIGTTDVPWTSVARVEETDGYVYIFVGPIQAFILPLRDQPDRVREFASTVRNQIAAAPPPPT